MMNRTRIEWCDATYNPVTGCLRGCPYCYARRIAVRFSKDDNLERDWRADFDRNGNMVLYHPVMVTQDGRRTVDPYPMGFAPTFHMYRLDEPSHLKRPSRVFVCSMADLFGDWVPDGWIMRVLASCAAAPMHEYLLLTKNPARYAELQRSGLLPDLPNFWYGTTMTDPRDPWFPGAPGRWYRTFISIEPIAASWDGGEGPLRSADWVVVGAETGNRRGKVVPEKGWIDGIVGTCDGAGTAVFMKDSLVPIVGGDGMRRDIPGRRM